MEEVMTRRKWVAPTRKLTAEEIQALVDNYDYDPNWDEEVGDDYSEPIYDRFGNPTESTIRAFYESEHGLCEEVTLEELLAPYEND